MCVGKVYFSFCIIQGRFVANMLIVNVNAFIHFVFYKQPVVLYLPTSYFCSIFTMKTLTI